MDAKNLLTESIRARSFEEFTQSTQIDIVQVELICEDSLTCIKECLEKYWVKQGIPKDKARAAAEKSLEKILSNTCKDTWCLLPEL